MPQPLPTKTFKDPGVSQASAKAFSVLVTSSLLTEILTNPVISEENSPNKRSLVLEVALIQKDQVFKAAGDYLQVKGGEEKVKQLTARPFPLTEDRKT